MATAMAERNRDAREKREGVVVPEVGLEPTRPCGQRILNP